MMCSAISLGCSRQLAGHAPVVLVGAAAAAGAGDRAGDHLAVEQLHHRLGRRADDGDLGVAQEVHVRARVHLAQHPVDVERVGVEVEVEALRQHHLEDVAGQDVLLGHLDRLLVHARRASLERTSGSGSAGSGGATGDVGERAAEVGDRHRLDPGRRPGRRRRRGSAASARAPARSRSAYTRWRQWSKAARLPITLITASGRSTVVGGHVGEVLDLADHVVAEVARRRRPAAAGGRARAGDRYACEQRLEGGEHAPVERDRRRGWRRRR